MAGGDEFVFHLLQVRIGMAGIEMGYQETLGLGDGGFLQAEGGSAMSPAAPLFMLLIGVLAVTNQEIGSPGHFEEWTSGINGGFIVRGKDKGAFAAGSGTVQPIGEASTRMPGESALHPQNLLAGREFHFLARLHLPEEKLGLQLRKSCGKVGRLLLGVQGLLNDIAGWAAGEAG